jgi:hypothetical protein
MTPLPHSHIRTHTHRVFCLMRIPTLGSVGHVCGKQRGQWPIETEKHRRWGNTINVLSGLTSASFSLEKYLRPARDTSSNNNKTNATRQQTRQPDTRQRDAFDPQAHYSHSSGMHADLPRQPQVY